MKLVYMGTPDIARVCLEKLHTAGFDIAAAYTKPDTPKKGIAELIIGKHRNGRVGTVELAFLPQYTAFEPLAKDR